MYTKYFKGFTNFYHWVLYIIILISFFLILPATITAKQGTGIIPIMPGAKILKQSAYKGSSRLELTTKNTPGKVASFYKQAMKRKGWPTGTIMTTGTRSALMLYDNGRQFALKASVKNGMTKVIITLVKKEQKKKVARIGNKLPSASSRPLENTRRLVSGHSVKPKVMVQPKDRVQGITHEMYSQPEDTYNEYTQTSPLLYPDFEIKDVAYWPERTRIRALVRNGAKPFNGQLQFRISLTDPYSPYTLDRTVSVPVSLNTTDSNWVTLFSDFQWPEPCEYPVLNVVAAVDPENHIKENNDRNNTFNKTLRVSCAVNIEALSNQHLVKGKGDNFAIYGIFGSRQAGRFVCLEKGGSRDKLFVRSWHNGTIIVDVSNKGTGTYDVVVYCSDPDTTEAYESNRKTLEIVKKKSKVQFSSGPFNAEDMANAMASGYEDWFEVDDSSNIKKIRVENGNPGAIVNCVFIQKPFSVTLEIYQYDFRIEYQEITDFSQSDEGYVLRREFVTLSPGIYDLKCMQKNNMGIIKHANSFSFRLQ